MCLSKFFLHSASALDVVMRVSGECYHSLCCCGVSQYLLYLQVYISQILVASALGAMVEAVGSVRVIPVVASGGSFLGFLTACFLVIYPDVEPSSSEQGQGLVDSEQNGERTSDQRLDILTDKDGLKKTDDQAVA